MSEPAAPILIIGMHRSGTSLLAEMLADCGVWMGADCAQHTESVFFRNQNKAIFQAAHAEWDRPLGVRDLLTCEPLADEAAQFLEAAVRSKEAREYLGAQSLLRPASLTNMNKAWGWKDPRTTFTLPLWLRLYPNAKVAHIYRNGVDVAASLRKRERERKQMMKAPAFSARCMDLDRAFELWREYTAEGFEQAQALPEGQAQHVQYEAFLQNPREMFLQLAEVFELPLEKAGLERAVARVNAGRIYAFREDAELRGLYERRQGDGWMGKLGYGNLL